MNGIYGLENSKVRADFYSDFRQEKNFSPTEIIQENEWEEKKVPEDVSELFKNADNYSPISFNLFEKDDKTDAAGNTHGVVLNPGASTHKAMGKKSSPAECETCARRTYKDGSDEMDVSFKTPSKIPQSIAASVVLGHEHEHVANAYEKESNGEGEVKRVSVTLHNDICPECGRVYVSGGLTHTEMTKSDENKNHSHAHDDLRGSIVDLQS
ncbi:MAG: hypothetical protein IJU55_03405 [Selenomonadaceae bacterium]|nr:hypothetical protein [Selenomonadaceae bacterium]